MLQQQPNIKIIIKLMCSGIAFERLPNKTNHDKEWPNEIRRHARHGCVTQSGSHYKKLSMYLHTYQPTIQASIWIRCNIDPTRPCTSTDTRRRLVLALFLSQVLYVGETAHNPTEILYAFPGSVAFTTTPSAKQ